MTQPIGDEAVGALLAFARRALDTRWVERDAGVELRMAIRTVEHSLSELQAKLKQYEQEQFQHDHHMRRLTTQYYQQLATLAGSTADQHDLLEAILLLEEKLVALPPERLNPMRVAARMLVALPIDTPVLWRNGMASWEGYLLARPPYLRWEEKHATPHWEIVLEGRHCHQGKVILPSLEFVQSSPLQRHLYVGRHKIEELFEREDLTCMTPAGRDAMRQALEGVGLPHLASF